MSRQITILTPSDMHQHLREGGLLAVVAPLVFARFKTALIMPNLTAPIVGYQQMRNYRKSIISCARRDDANPVMTMYMTDTLDLAELDKALAEPFFVGVKYYPRGLTTNSDSGIENPSDLWTAGSRAYTILRHIAAAGKVVLLHAAEGVDHDGDEIDPFDQEPYFIRESLPRILDAHPDLKVSVEHLSSETGVNFMLENGDAEKLGCSLTAHHLLLDRRDMLRGGMRPNRFWWPIIQAQEHRDALRDLVKARKAFVWLGSDSAPHRASGKYSECCKGGVLMAHAGIELYVEAFDAIGALDYLEQFASLNGPRFFGLEKPTTKITLEDTRWTMGDMFFTSIADDDPIIPFRHKEEILWSIIPNL